MFFAHSTADLTRSNWHLLRDHLLSVSGLAGIRGRKFGAEKAAALAGILHDLGKYTAVFQRRLDGAEVSVDHSTAGAQEVRRVVSGGQDRGMAELIAYAIAGHHAGLPDGQGDGSSLSERLSRRIEEPNAAWRDELPVDAKGLFPPGFSPHPDRNRLPFQLGFLGRMLFSCLVDADFRDTEAFYAKSEGFAVDRRWAALPAIVDGLIAALERHIAEKRADAAETLVNRFRRQILTHVLARADAAPGIFTLTVPTGGGKTLASLAFALAHAKRYELERIIYAIPFTSVIDQTAAIFRDILGEDLVLEHHSALDERRLSDREARDKLRLAMEDWAAPIVVTTNVQLFESLFASRPSRCRKLHNLARSVIVLDEAQTIPLPVLRPCVAAIDELARNYDASIVLCTATQPALAAPDFPGGLALGPERELAPEPRKLATSLNRVELRQAGDLTDDALLEALASTLQGLVIVNSRAHALALYRRAVDMGLAGTIHLTTRQYAAHRRTILAEVRHRLAGRQPCKLLATSLVEAGVDLDFPRVWRAEAGLDQIPQAAGRCNREGRRPVDESVVTVFRAPEHPTPREIAQLAGDLQRIVGRHEDLFSLDAIRDFFGEVYWRKGDRLDAKRILDAFRADHTGIDFAFRRVGEDFRLIESGLAPVIIARDMAARQALERLKHVEASAGAIARALQPYTVQIPPKARLLLAQNGHLHFHEQGRFGDQFGVLATDSLYREDTGLLWEEADYLDLENAII